MGPMLDVVCPCFRKNVIVTCKIMSFCSLAFLQTNEIVLICGNQFSKWRSFEKNEKKNPTIFGLLFTFFSHQGMTQKLIRRISHLHKYTYLAYPFDFFFFFFFFFLP